MGIKWEEQEEWIILRIEEQTNKIRVEQAFQNMQSGADQRNQIQTIESILLEVQQ